MNNQYMNQVFPRQQIERVGDIFRYTIQRGDNLYEIAKMFNTRMELIAALNSINVNDIIYPDNELLIPVLHTMTLARETVDTQPYQASMNYGMSDNGMNYGMPDNGMNYGMPDNGRNYGIPDNGMNYGMPDNGMNYGMPDNGMNCGMPDNGMRNMTNPYESYF